VLKQKHFDGPNDAPKYAFRDQKMGRGTTPPNGEGEGNTPISDPHITAPLFFAPEIQIMDPPLPSITTNKDGMRFEK